MTALVVFVEEASARIVVEALLQRLLPDGSCIVVPHDGKGDLVKSYPRKIGAWEYPKSVPFIVLHDNDGGDCAILKKRLTHLVPPRKKSRTRIRIVMQSLEAWYLGDFEALAAAGLIKPEKAKQLNGNAKFRNPDRVTNAKEEFFRLHDESGQMAVARLIAPHLNFDRNRSHSFKIFVQTVRDLTSLGREI